MPKQATKPTAPAATAAAAPAGRAAQTAPTETADLQAALAQATQSLVEADITLESDQPAAPPAGPAAPEGARSIAPQPRTSKPDEEDTEADDEEADPDEVTPAEADTDPDEGEADDTEEAAEETAENPEAAAEEFEAETPEELEHEATAKGWPKSASKRLTKLLKQKTALQAQLAGAEQLRQERDALKAKLESGETAAPSEPAPLTVTAVERQLAGEIAAKEQWLTMIESNPDGLTLQNDKGQDVTYTPAQLAAARRRFERDITRAELRLDQHRAEMARQTAEYSQAAETQHAFLKDKTSAEYQAIQKVIRAFPDVARIPDHLSVLANAIT
jgi:hypothetical protein